MIWAMISDDDSRAIAPGDGLGRWRLVVARAMTP